jgi:hypothetical protein
MSESITLPSRKDAKLGGEAATARPAAARSESAKKAAATQKRKASGGYVGQTVVGL